MHKILEFKNSTQIVPGVILALVFCLFSQGINNLIAIELVKVIEEDEVKTKKPAQSNAGLGRCLSAATLRAHDRGSKLLGHVLQMTRIASW